MERNPPRLFIIALVLALTSCTGASSLGKPSPLDSDTGTTSVVSDFEADADAAFIAGQAFYRERIALPPGAVFTATLEDISRAGARAVTVGQTVLVDPAVPVRFRIAYTPEDIKPHGRYAVRATISFDNKLRFAPDTVYPVLSHAEDHYVEILMVMVGDVVPSIESSGSTIAQAWPSYGLQLPATFRGDLPCADCEAIRHQLDLWPDQIFHLRREWLGKARPLVVGDMGRWKVDPERQVLSLSKGMDVIAQLRSVDAAQLRLLDLEGQSIESVLPYELNSIGYLAMGDIPGEFVGHMRYMADAARFTECATGRSYLIAPNEQALQMARQYLANVEQPGGLLAMRFRGELTQRLSMEGDLFEPTWVVEQFVGLVGNEDCPS